MWSLAAGVRGGASPLMRGTSSRVQAHFLFLKVNRQPAGVWGVMGKEETVMLIRPAHTSPSNNKTKQEWKHGKATDNCGGMGLYCCHSPRFEPYVMMIVLRRKVLFDKQRKEVICCCFTVRV